VPSRALAGHPVYGGTVLPAKNRGSRSPLAGVRWSVAPLLLILSLVLTGCISVTPAPGSQPPSGTPGAISSAAPSVEPSADPTGEAATPEPGATMTPEPSPTAEPTLPPTPSALPSREPSETAAGSTTPPNEGPSSAPATLGPAGSQAPAVSGGPVPDASPSATPKPAVTPPLLTPGPPRDRALAKTEVYGFLPYWEMANADTLDLEQLTTLAFFGVEVNARGNVVRGANGVDAPGWAAFNGPVWADLQSRAQAAGVRTVLTIERFSWTDSQRRRTIRLLSDPAARMRATAQIMALVTERNLDGINLDFEPMPAEVSADFTQFVRELRAAMNAVDPTLQLTFDVMPGIENYDVAALTAEDAADALFVMGYEYLTGAAARTGSNAPLVSITGPRDLTGDVANILSQVGPDVVILGLPWYGRAWSTVSAQPHAGTRGGDRFPTSVTINYDDAIRQAMRTGRLYDDVEESAWSLYPSKVADCQACRVTWRQLWYDDVDATRAKVDFALDQSLRGVGFWALGYQGSGPEMWSVLELTVGGGQDRRPPTGTAELDPGSVTGQRQDLPVVGPRVTLQLTARDGAQGSGPAFVRIAVDGALDEDGQLVGGTTYPMTDAITFDPSTASPVYDLPLPRAARPRATPTPGPSVVPSAEPSAVPGTSPSSSPSAPPPSPPASPSASASPATAGSPSAVPSASPGAEPTPAPTGTGKAGRRTLFVQWRDVAGNWSEPITIEVFYRPNARPEATPPVEATPSLVPSGPPVVPGEEPDTEESPEPSGSPAA
jgi:spore germination protein YaaH